MEPDLEAGQGIPPRDSSSVIDATIRELERTSGRGGIRRRTADALEKFFRMHERETTIATEIRAGCVTFITMSYIVIVNPHILANCFEPSRGDLSKETTGQIRDPVVFGHIHAATCVTAIIACLWVGLFANLPFGMAAGMGLNSYFTYGVCWLLDVKPGAALVAVLVQGVTFALLSVTGLCNAVQALCPDCIKKALTVAIGLFQAFIGLRFAGVVVPSPHTLVTLGDLTSMNMWLAISGVLLIAVLLSFNVKGSMVMGIGFVTITSWVMGLTDPPKAVFAFPNFMNPLHALDFQAFWDDSGKLLWVALALLVVALFDTAGVQFGAGLQAGLIDQGGKLPGSRQAFLASSVATTVAAPLGCSPVIIHNESCAGIHEGGRTGLTAIVVAIGFVIALFFPPLFGCVPAIAAAPPLVGLGIFMMAPCRFIDWDDLEQAFPAFLTIAVMPLTFSIANGVVAGLVSYFAFLSIRTIILAIVKLLERWTERWTPPRWLRWMKGGESANQVMRHRSTSPGGCASPRSRSNIDYEWNMTIDELEQPLNAQPAEDKDGVTPAPKPDNVHIPIVHRGSRRREGEGEEGGEPAAMLSSPVSIQGGGLGYTIIPHSTRNSQHGSYASVWEAKALQEGGVQSLGVGHPYIRRDLAPPLPRSLKRGFYTPDPYPAAPIGSSSSAAKDPRVTADSTDRPPGGKDETSVRPPSSLPGDAPDRRVDVIVSIDTEKSVDKDKDKAAK